MAKFRKETASAVSNTEGFEEALKPRYSIAIAISTHNNKSVSEPTTRAFTGVLNVIRGITIRAYGLGDQTVFCVSQSSAPWDVDLRILGYSLQNHPGRARASKGKVEIEITVPVARQLASARLRSAGREKKV